MDVPCRPRMQIRSVLLCLVFCLLQAAFGTTVIPLCDSDEMENCTTALIQMASSSRVALVETASCKPEMKDYCIHGQCVYLVDLQEHSCRCDVGFSGVRCVHTELVRDYEYLSIEYLVLIIILVLFVLIAISIAAYFLYTWHQNKKKRQANKRDYKEVDAYEKDPTLLPI